LDRKGNPVFAIVTGNHRGLPLLLGFEGEVAIVGANPMSRQWWFICCCGWLFTLSSSKQAISDH